MITVDMVRDAGYESDLDDIIIQERLDLVEDIFALVTRGTSTREDLDDNDMANLARSARYQLEYWDYIDPDMDMMMGTRQNLEVGSKSMQYKLHTIAPRAYRHLRRCGFIKNGVGI